MRTASLLLGRLLMVTACLLTVATSEVAAPSAAHAASLTPVAVTQTASRNYGDGGPAADALVHAWVQTVDSSGAIVLYDRNSHQIRRVDPVTGLISVVAGSGATAPSKSAVCTLDTTQPASDVYLGSVGGLWSDDAGDLFMWQAGNPECFDWPDIYRLDPKDHGWHLAVAQMATPCCLTPNGAYHAMAVDAAGTVYVSDTLNHVLRAFPLGADPHSTGTIVAGTVGSSGNTGDGGPATSATISDPDVLAAAADGTLYLANYYGHTIRRVDAATGVIDTVAGDGQATPYLNLSADDGKPATAAAIDVNAISVGADGTVFFTDMSSSSGKAAERAFTVGGTVRTVVGPASPNSDGDPALCPGTAITADGNRLLVSCGGTLRGWPTDGSAAGAEGTPVAGVSDAASYASRDGVPLSDAFLPPINAVAAAPDGTIGLATSTGIRTLTGLAPDATLGTLSRRDSSWLAYGSDGTLYTVVGNGTDADPQEILAIAPGGAVTVVAGGGTGALADGTAATTVSLPVLTGTALDAGTGTIFFGARSTNQVWALDLTGGQLHPFAGTADGSGTFVDGQQASSAPLDGSHGVAVDPTTHAVYVESAGLYRIDADGTIHTVGCTTDCNNGLVVAPDGTLYSFGSGTVVVLHPNGVTATDLPDLSGPLTVLADGTLLGLPAGTFGAPPGAGGAGGLLATAPEPDDTFPGPTASFTATPGAASVSVTVTPPAVSGDVVTVEATESPAAPIYPTGAVSLTSFSTDGTGSPRTFTFTHLGPGGTSGPGFTAGQSYRFEVFTAAFSTTTPHITVTSPAATAIVVPEADTTPPAAPTLSVGGGPTTLTWTVGLPSDADLVSVKLRWTSGTSPPSSPQDGYGPDYIVGSSYRPGQTVNGQVYAGIDPMQTYTFAAWATDTSGNVSGPVTGSRGPAQLTAGHPVTDLGYQAQGDGTTAVIWTEPNDAIIRYAAGDTVPATPSDGQRGYLGSSVWGIDARVPAAAGAHVAVALFRYNPDGSNTYFRDGFVLVGGTSTDTLTLSGPTKVAPGAKPALTATLTRHGPLQTMPLTAARVDLYRRAVGSSTWTGVAGGFTSGTGTITFTAPAQRVGTVYEVRTSASGPRVLLRDHTVLVTSSLSAALSRTTVRHRYPVYVAGVFTPHAKVTVRLQRYYGSAWHTVTTMVTSSTGAYRFRYVPASRGTYLLRGAFRGSTAWLASTSRKLKLTAT